jgi:hypothetical protein
VVNLDRPNVVRLSGFSNCEWISIFYRTDLEKWMLLKGNFEAQLRGTRICYFKEIFIKQKFDIRPSLEQNIKFRTIIKE